MNILNNITLKFFFLLMTISIIALTGTFTIQRLLIMDFEKYLEGEMEDRVYIAMAGLEERYRKIKIWQGKDVSEEIARALMIGIDITLRDREGNKVIDSRESLELVAPEMRRKIVSMVDTSSFINEEPVNYPLFLKGEEIGSIDVRFLKPVRESVFRERAERFLLILLFLLGGVSIIFSFLISKRVTYPLRRLTEMAGRVSHGDFTKRVEIKSRDEIGRLATTFNMMLDNLLLQESLRKKLITNVAHELRTPLASMRNEIEAMIDGVNVVDREGLERIHREILRLKRIIDGIEEYTSAQASRVFLKKELIRLREFLEPIVERYRTLKSKLLIRLDCDDSVFIHADPERLAEIVINLLDNAIKATSFVEKPELSIRAGIKNGETFIEIRDNGCGMRSEEIPFIFERFYRRFEDGLGLGLSIVKELVDAHNGRIEVRSDYGRGSAFTVYIPIEERILHNSS